MKEKIEKINKLCEKIQKSAKIINDGLKNDENMDKKDLPEDEESFKKESPFEKNRKKLAAKKRLPKVINK